MLCVFSVFCESFYWALLLEVLFCMNVGNSEKHANGPILKIPKKKRYFLFISSAHVVFSVYLTKTRTVFIDKIGRFILPSVQQYRKETCPSCLFMDGRSRFALCTKNNIWSSNTTPTFHEFLDRVIKELTRSRHGHALPYKVPQLPKYGSSDFSSC